MNRRTADPGSRVPEKRDSLLKGLLRSLKRTSSEAGQEAPVQTEEPHRESGIKEQFKAGRSEEEEGLVEGLDVQAEELMTELNTLNLSIKGDLGHSSYDHAPDAQALFQLSNRANQDFLLLAHLVNTPRLHLLLESTIVMAKADMERLKMNKAALMEGSTRMKVRLGPVIPGDRDFPCRKWDTWSEEKKNEQVGREIDELIALQGYLWRAYEADGLREAVGTPSRGQAMEVKVLLQQEIARARNASEVRDRAFKVKEFEDLRCNHGYLAKAVADLQTEAARNTIKNIVLDINNQVFRVLAVEGNVGTTRERIVRHLEGLKREAEEGLRSYPNGALAARLKAAMEPVSIAVRLLGRTETSQATRASIEKQARAGVLAVCGQMGLAIATGGVHIRTDSPDIKITMTEMRALKGMLSACNQAMSRANDEALMVLDEISSGEKAAEEKNQSGD